MECIIDIESISSQNVQHYLRALEQDIWDSAEPIKVKEQNYRKIDWDKTVAYDVNSSRLIAIDYNGYAYEYRRKSSPLIDDYLGEHLGEAYSDMILLILGDEGLEP